MKTALLQIPGINSVTAAYESLSFVQWSDGLNANTTMGKKSISINAIPAEMDFVKTLGMQLLAGRDFIKADLLEMDTANDGANYKASFILNETAVKGVVKDFHFASLHQPIVYRAIGPKPFSRSMKPFPIAKVLLNPTIFSFTVCG